MKKIIITHLLIILSFFCKAQVCTDVKELLRKRHTISGMTYGHPYTTFDRHNGLSFNSTISNIRESIKTNKLIKDIYFSIYNNAISSMPTDLGIPSDKSVSKSAIWAKDNAFVFLIGLDSVGNRMDYTFYNGSTTYSPNKRDKFRDNATSAFSYIGGVMNSNNGYMQGYARSLIQWLQAYDLLKAAYEIRGELDSLAPYRYPWGFGDADANKDGSCSPRRKLRKITRDIYNNSTGVFGIMTHRTGWKKNHGLAAASAILMSAQVLNDAGVETERIWGFIKWLFTLGNEPFPYPNYSPVNWNEDAKEAFDDNLFEGYHWWPAKNVPQAPKNSTPDSYSAFAEGPSYVNYGFLDCGIPAMITQKNLYPDWTDEPFIKKNEILNIFNWFANLQTADGTLPSYDNSSNEQNPTLSITGIPKFNRGTEGLSASLYVDYVAMVGGNKIPINIEKKPTVEEMPSNAGNVVLRNETDTTNHTFYMLFEDGKAIDVEAHILDDTHEDDDMGSFMIYTSNKGKKSVPLAVDPPYFGWGNEESTNKYWMHNTIEIDDGQPAKDREYIAPHYSFVKEQVIDKNNSIQSFDLSFAYASLTYTANYIPNAIKRNVNAIKSENMLYYFINDYVDVTSISLAQQYINLNLNGNGNTTFNGDSSLLSYRRVFDGDYLHRWTYPCSTSNWSLTAHVSALNNSISGKGFWENYYTNNTENGSKAANIAGGYVTRLQIHQPVKKPFSNHFFTLKNVLMLYQM